MSGVSLPVTRPAGRALVVGNSACRSEAMETLQRLGYSCAGVEDPYQAMAEISHRPLAYRAVILSLASLHREELSLVSAIRHRFPNLEVWLTHTDGRQASLAEAMRLGAQGLLAPDGLHRTAASSAPPPVTPTAPPESDDDVGGETIDGGMPEAVLTADELRALLQDQPTPGSQEP